jgi:hypothetical protein
MTGMGYRGAKLGGNSHLPMKSTSTTIDHQAPTESPAHSTAPKDQSRTRENSIMPWDLSEAVVPKFSPAGWGTQTSGPMRSMPSAPPQDSLSTTQSSGIYPSAAQDSDSDYGVMPVSEWGPRHLPAGTVLSIPIATSHRELAEAFCRSGSPATPLSPPTYGSIYTGPTESVRSPMDLPAPPSSFAGGESRPRLQTRSWGSGDELYFAATSPSTQLQQRPVFHVYIGGDFFDDPHPGASRLDTRSRSTQNKPSIWAKITAATSRVHTRMFGKGPKHVWP